MKKKIVALSAALLILTAISGTLAYTESSQSSETAMSTGNVHIEQIEKERIPGTNNLRAFSQNKYVEPAYFADGQLKWSDTEQSWTEVSAPGSNRLYDNSVKNVIDKFVFVKNDGDKDVYYRTIIAIECPEGLDINLIGLNLNENPKFKWDDWGYKNINNKRYFVKVATYQGKLIPGEVSIPSLLQIYLKPQTTNKDIELIGEEFDIIVRSQATPATDGVTPEVKLNDTYKDVL